MEDTSSSTKEVKSQGPPVYFPNSFHEAVRDILRCFGLESRFQQNPNNSCPKEDDDDGKLNHNPLGQPQKESSDPPSSTDHYSDPSSTVIDSAPDPPSITGDNDGAGVPIVSLSTPTRPGTGRGSGPQKN